MAAADVTANWMGCCGPATIANDPLMRGLTNSSAESIVGIFGVLSLVFPGWSLLNSRAL